MGMKILSLLLLVFVSQGFGADIRLDDVYITHLTNDLIGRGIGIAKSFLDKLEVCNVIFPNGIRYQAYPVDRTPDTVMFLRAAEPFTSCSIGFRGVDVSMSGTYELESMVRHRSNDSLTLTRQRFHMTFVEIKEDSEEEEEEEVASE